MPSYKEKLFAQVWRKLGGPELVREHQFHAERRWRFDFAHPATTTAIEIEGGVWSQGRHTRGAGYIADCEKYNECQFAGWSLFRLTEIHRPTLKRIIHHIQTHPDFKPSPPPHPHLHRRRGPG